MPREYDYQDIEVRFGDLRVAAPGVSAAPGLLYEQQYMGGYTPRQANHLARDVEFYATEWWRQNAPVALQLDIYIRRDVEFTVTGAAGEHRLVAIPLQEVEADVRRSVDRALSQLLYDTVQPPMRPHWRAALDAAVRDVHVEGTFSLEPEPAPPRKTFWEVILEEE